MITASDEQQRAEARARVDEIAVWRHRIDLGGGIVTPGREDTAAELARLRVPVDLRDRTVLDVGCSDGFYSFECERRGATVVAVDDESSLLAGSGNGFRVAHDLLGSGVEYRAADVEDLPADDTRRYDVVLFVNVLYHLRNPMRALQELARVTKPGGLLICKTYFGADLRKWVKGRCISIDVDRRPKAWYFPTTELAGDPTNWWAPNRAALDALLSASGWGAVERLPDHGDRAYRHARRDIELP